MESPDGDENFRSFDFAQDGFAGFLPSSFAKATKDKSVEMTPPCEMAGLNTNPQDRPAG